MRASRRLALLGLAVLSMYLFSLGGGLTLLRGAAQERLDAGRMRNVTVEREERLPVSMPIPEATPSPVPAAIQTPAPTPLPAAPAPAAQTLSAPQEPAGEPLVTVLETRPNQEIRETTIQGGLAIKNETGYSVDAYELMQNTPLPSLPAEGPQILIIHTHGSEAYTQAGLDRYEAEDNERTADTNYNIIRVGDELAQLLSEAGLHVLHDREIYDYPSYTGSYTRSGEAVARYLEAYPDIAMVIDVHRDALGADGVVYKTMAEEQGVVASQVMLLVGSDDSGLEHPNWRGNLALALYLQDRIGRQHPTLMRPVSLVPQRYNQHLTPGSLILEVGSSGNTLQEALAAVRLFAQGAAPALLELVEQGGEA